MDVLKAAAIGMVVLSHAIRLVYHGAVNGPWAMAAAFTAMSVLHVPLFVFISGYLLPKTPSLRWLGQRAARLLVPFFVWGAIQWVAWYHVKGAGWLLSIAVWPEETSVVWFLYALTLLCGIYAIAGRSKELLVALAVAAVILPPPTSLMFVVRYVVMLLPVFVAGRLASDRRFEPRWWSLPIAAALMVVMWPSAGASMFISGPAWASALAHGLPAWGAFAVGAGVRVLRLALELSLVASAFYLARNARRGAWLGQLTLGVYCAHILLLPEWARGQGAIGVAAAFATATAAAVGVTLLLGRWETTSFLLLGSGTLPSWVGAGLSRLRAAHDPE